MNRTSFRWIPVVLVLAGCSGAPELFVSNMQDLNTTERNTYVYSLPRTVVNIEVEIQKAIFIPGPYHEYAARYLGLKGVGHDDDESWNIRKIKLFASVEPDPDHFYAANTEGDFRKLNEELDLLSQSGQIILPGGFVINGPVTTEIDIPEEHEIYFEDLSVKRNLVVEKETSYKRIFRDSVYVQMPVEKKYLVQKKPVQKAEEAANFIIKLRKRRFKLLTGQHEGDIPDEAIEAVIDELNQTEQEYLELFTGRTIYKTETFHFDYLPVSEKTTDQKILFKLSGNEGIFDAMSPKGKPVVLEIECLDLTQNLKVLPSPEAGNTLYYRQPDLARIIISFDNTRVCENKLTIYQYGSVVGKKINEK